MGITGYMRSAGVFYLHVTLDPEIGEEVVLIVYDPTDFIYQLAEVTPFRFHAGSLAVNMSYGPVFVFLFWVTDPTDERKVFAAFDKPIDISNRSAFEPWIRLRDRSHLHLLLLDSDHEVQGRMNLRIITVLRKRSRCYHISTHKEFRTLERPNRSISLITACRIWWKWFDERFKEKEQCMAAAGKNSRNHGQANLNTTKGVRSLRLISGKLIFSQAQWLSN
jgi:hypothetical protein